MSILKDKEREYVKKHLEKLTNPVKLVLFTQEFECQFCKEARELCEDISSLSGMVTIEVYDFTADKHKVEQYDIKRIPAIVIEGDRDYGIRFYGIPTGYEFFTIIEAMIDVSNGKTGLTETTKDRVRSLTKPVHIQVFVTPT